MLLAATPILLKNLGAMSFGLWSLLMTIAAAGAIISIGLQTSVVKLVAENPTLAARTNQTVQTAMGLAVIAGGLLAAIVAAVGAITSTNLLSKMGGREEIIVTGCVAALLLWIEQCDVVISAFLKGSEKFSLAARLEITSKFVQIGSSIAAAIVHHNIYAVYVALLVTAVLRLVVKAAIAKISCPEVSFKPSCTSLTLILRYAKWSWLQGAGSLLFITADRMVVGSTLGSVSLGYYSIATQLAAQLHTITASAFGIIVPRVSRHAASGITPLSLRKVAKKLVLINVAVSVAGAILLSTFARSIFSHWVGVAIFEQIEPMFKVLVVVYLVLSLSVVPYFFLNGFGQLRLIAVVCLIGGTLALICSVILIPRLGLEGAALSRGFYAVSALFLFVPVLQKLAR